MLTVLPSLPPPHPILSYPIPASQPPARPEPRKSDRRWVCATCKRLHTDATSFCAPLPAVSRIATHLSSSSPRRRRLSDRCVASPSGGPPPPSLRQRWSTRCHLSLSPCLSPRLPGPPCSPPRCRPPLLPTAWESPSMGPGLLTQRP